MTNVLFYKIPDTWFNLNTNSITIDNTLFTLVDPNRDLNVFQKLSKINTGGRIIKLKPNNQLYKELTDGPAFIMLRKLRNGLLANANGKQFIAKEGIKIAFKALFNI